MIADPRVLILDEATVEAGRIAERGTHDELMARGGLYAELYHRQFREPREARQV